MLVGGVSFFALLFLVYNLVFFRKIYPGVSAANIPLTGQSSEEALVQINEKVRFPERIVLISEAMEYEILLDEVGFSFDFPETTHEAYKIGRTGNIFTDFYTRLIIPFEKTNLPLAINLDETKLSEHLSLIADAASEIPVYPSASYEEGVVLIEKGKPGIKINQGELNINIIRNLTLVNLKPILIPQTVVDPTLTNEEAALFKKRAENLIGKEVELAYEDEVYILSENDIYSFLNPKDGYTNGINVISEITSTLNSNPQNPIFVFEEGRVTEFAPSKDGVMVNSDELIAKILEIIKNFETTDETYASIEIPVSTVSPDISTEEVNSLGINELIGKGTSRFIGSISSRIHNIGVASSRFNGILIAPGETFSFNNTLGDVSSYTGYKQAYIIKDGRTVLGDGGGVCQVSTTFFRAALDAGLPIIERRAHSYRVSYYEQDALPGFDATVYAPYTDLKILNDTPAHMLIQTEFDSRAATLAFEIYGTSDKRKASTTKPLVTSVVPPPEDLYQDDPTLPAGTIKKIDYQAWGAKVSFDYKVEKAGEIIFEQTFHSNFRPWQAVYLRGTGPIN